MNLRTAPSYPVLLLFILLPVSPLLAQCTTCDYTQADLISGAISTIPAGKKLCITANTCVGYNSTSPACANGGPGALIIYGELRICPGVTFNYAGTITGTGIINILSGSHMYMYGTYDCAVKIAAVDPSLSTGTSVSTSIGGSTGSCNDPSCDATFPDGYIPFGVVATGMGITAYDGSCKVTGLPAASILPLSLTDWELAWKGSDILLQWSTPENEPGASYEIDWTKDGSSWQMLSRIFSGPDVTSYSYLAAGPFGNHNFFRLKQTSTSGAIYYSTIKELDLDAGGDDHIVIGPNPVSSFLYLSDGSNTSTLELFDMTGRSIAQLPGSPSGSYDLQSITAGSYALVIIRKDGSRVVKKITKL